MDDDNEYMTIAEAAIQLRMSRRQVSRLIVAGTLTVHRHPLFKKGARVRIPAAQVAALLARALHAAADICVADGD